MKHEKEIQFDIWKAKLAEKWPETILGSIRSSKEVVEVRWKNVGHVSAILCEGEQPVIKRFPSEYHQFQKKNYHHRRAKLKKTFGKSLSIVTNPENLGFLQKFHLSYFHVATHRWIDLGMFSGSVDAKTMQKLDLSAFEIVTNRIRIEPVEVFGTGCFNLKILGPESVNAKEQEQRSLVYELNLLIPTERNGYVLKEPSDHGMDRVTAKRRNSERKGKRFQKMMQSNQGL